MFGGTERAYNNPFTVATIIRGLDYRELSA